MMPSHHGAAHPQPGQAAEAVGGRICHATYNNSNTPDTMNVSKPLCVSAARAFDGEGRRFGADRASIAGRSGAARHTRASLGRCGGAALAPLGAHAAQAGSERL